MPIDPHSTGSVQQKDLNASNEGVEQTANKGQPGGYVALATSDLDVMNTGGIAMRGPYWGCDDNDLNASIFEASLSTDQNDRWHVKAGGVMEWGSGTGAVDTFLSRAGVGRLLVGGVLMPAQFPTASAPPYVKGGLYFDTTLNKLRVGGATAWETVTSS